MRFASLGSGSAGNSLVVEIAQTRVLLDCGFNVKETLIRLARLNLTPSDLSGIVVTHEHEDHASGVFKFAAKYQIPVWLTYGTLKMVERYLPNQHNLQINIIDSHAPFSIRDIEVRPFPVPHDAREPVQYVFSSGHCALGVLTDVGRSTPHIEMMLNECQALVLECNHDANMLQSGPYSGSLKKRVAGDLGHLENAASAALLKRLNHRSMQHVVAAHLSAKNNTALLARSALANVLGCEVNLIAVADQLLGLDWRDIR